MESCCPKSVMHMALSCTDHWLEEDDLLVFDQLRIGCTASRTCSGGSKVWGMCMLKKNRRLFSSGGWVYIWPCFLDSSPLLPAPVLCHDTISLLWLSLFSAVFLSLLLSACLRSRHLRLYSQSSNCLWMLRAQSTDQLSPRLAPLTVQAVYW